MFILLTCMLACSKSHIFTRSFDQHKVDSHRQNYFIFENWFCTVMWQFYICCIAAFASTNLNPPTTTHVLGWVISRGGLYLNSSLKNVWGDVPGTVPLGLWLAQNGAEQVGSMKPAAAVINIQFLHRDAMWSKIWFNLGPYYNNSRDTIS